MATEKKLKETPALLKMPSGYILMNPWLTIATKQMELMQRLAAELGMTPSSRSRVETVMRPSSPLNAVSISADGAFRSHSSMMNFSCLRRPLFVIEGTTSRKTLSSAKLAH